MMITNYINIINLQIKHSLFLILILFLICRLTQLNSITVKSIKAYNSKRYTTRYNCIRVLQCSPVSGENLTRSSNLYIVYVIHDNHYYV